MIELLVVVSIIALLLAIMLPALGYAKQQAKSVYCLNNVRQLALAANIYSYDNEDYYPIAYYSSMSESESKQFAWDFNVVKNWDSGTTTITAGILWQGDRVAEEIMQCPSYINDEITQPEPYTGYNYNTTYIGHGSGEACPRPAKNTQVKRPSNCAMFGDGQYADGPNKFMRSPWAVTGVDEFSYRYTGTQGFRHNGGTNVAWCDGSAGTLKEAFSETELPEMVGEGTGFLSNDNRLYDLK